MNRIIPVGIGLAVLASAGLTLAQDPPRHARPGQCFGRVQLPPAERVEQGRVLLRPGHVERRAIPALYERAERRVLVQPERRERYRVPALYRREERTMEVPGSRRWVRQPARYEDVGRRVLVEPGHAEWRHAAARLVSGSSYSGSGQTKVTPTGEVLCRVWIPARYGWESRRVLAAPSRSYLVQGSPASQTVVRHVLVRPEHWEKRTLPAQYRWVPERRLVSPAHVETIRIPPRYGWAERTWTGHPRSGWAEVVCGGPLSRAGMARLQAALNRRGYDAGPPDGRERDETYTALRRFQRDRRMAVGQVTVESARALGLIP